MLIHGIVAGQAASTKSATFDEPVHAMSGLLQWRYGDYRLNAEHPPLWKFVAGLSTRWVPLNVDLRSTQSQVMFANLNLQERWAVKTLFQTAENNGPALVDQARLGMLIFGALVVGLVGTWAHCLGGRVAGALAAWIAAMDPNLLAHSGLVTNDVACTAALAACFFATWRLHHRITLLTVAAWTLACGVALVIKFTALALPLLVAPVAVIRLLNPSPWPLGATRQLETLAARAGALIATAMLATVCAWLIIWASYGFRYQPTADPKLDFNIQFPAQLYAHNVVMRQVGKPPTPEELAERVQAVKPSLLQRGCAWGHERRLLPQAYLHGIAYAGAMSMASQSFLDGQRTWGGAVDYFPRAWSYKTPVATLLAIGLAVGWGGWHLIRQWRLPWGPWIYLVAPYGMLLVTAITYDMNIGLRHLLPTFPLMWIGLGWAGGLAWRRVRCRPLVLGWLVLASVETLTSHPHYIAFFNVAARGSNRGLDRLSDSNLDWGQDLKLLARWQRENPELPLYFSYFGSADPAAYGVRYFNIAPGYFYGTPLTVPEPQQPGILAYSATWLQGTYLPPGKQRDQLDLIRQRCQPLDVLGGSIYLYQLPLEITE